jgi:hypothetical protein
LHDKGFDTPAAQIDLERALEGARADDSMPRIVDMRKRTSAFSYSDGYAIGLPSGGLPMGLVG